MRPPHLAAVGRGRWLLISRHLLGQKALQEVRAGTEGVCDGAGPGRGGNVPGEQAGALLCRRAAESLSQTAPAERGRCELLNSGERVAAAPPGAHPGCGQCRHPALPSGTHRREAAQPHSLLTPPHPPPSHPQDDWSPLRPHRAGSLVVPVDGGAVDEPAAWASSGLSNQELLNLRS